MIYVNSNENEKSFKELYGKYYKKIYNYVFHTFLNKEISEDVTANVFFKALRYIKINNPRIDNFNAWIFRIASNEIINFKNRKLMKYKTESYDDNLTELVDFLNNDIADIKDKYNDFMIVRDALNKLKPFEKTIISLRFFENKSHSEISKILNIKENTLRPTLSRILVKLKKILKKHL